MMGTGCHSPTDQPQGTASPEMFATGPIEAGVPESGIRAIAPGTARTIGHDAFPTTIHPPETPRAAGRGSNGCDAVVLSPDGQGIVDPKFWTARGACICYDPPAFVA
jgi:hypothetical protein